MVLLKIYVITILFHSCFGTELILDPNNISNYQDIKTIKAMENIYLSDIKNRENDISKDIFVFPLGLWHDWPRIHIRNGLWNGQEVRVRHVEDGC